VKKPHCRECDCVLNFNGCDCVLNFAGNVLNEKENCYVQGENKVGPKSFCALVGFFLSVPFQFIGSRVAGGTCGGPKADQGQWRQVAGR
jgi:hypothetical protein